MISAPVATRYTSEFVRRSLPRGARRLLEVGCGAGELAARLQQDGMQVVAIDSDPDCVAAAHARGVDAHEAVWPAAIDGSFDAVLFTRSLHHIHELEAAVDAGRRALRPCGRIIVEDFRAEGGSKRSKAWYAGLVRLLEASGAFRSGFDAAPMLAKLDVSAHEHELHGSAAVRAALAGFAVLEEEDAAYYFRYFEQELEAAATGEALLAHELELIATGAIDALGKRFVAYH